MGITLLGLGALGLLDAFLIFQDGALGATPPHDKWVYIAAVAAFVIYFFHTEQDEWYEHLGFGAAMVGVGIDMIPRIFYWIYQPNIGFSFSTLFLVLFLILANLFLFVKKKTFSPPFIRFIKDDFLGVFNSMWFIYTCGILLIFSSMHYSMPENKCPTFILSIISKMETPITFSNITQWPLSVKIILGVTIFSIITEFLFIVTNKKIESKVLAIFEETAVTVDIICILKVYFFLTHHIFSWADFLVWIFLDMVIVLAPGFAFFPNTFRSYLSISKGIFDSVSDSIEPNDEIKKQLDEEERKWNDFIEDKGSYTNEELRVMGKLSVHESIDREIFREERRRKLEKENDD